MKHTYVLTGVPGSLVGYPRAYYNQFREFNSHRVHYSQGLFLALKKIISGKGDRASYQHWMKIEQWEC